CRPYRAKTKGKVERVIRELKADFLAWATGQPMPPQPMLADYDRLAATWCTQVVAARRHRTTGRVVAEAWSQERPLLGQIPARVLSRPPRWGRPSPGPGDRPRRAPQRRRRGGGPAAYRLPGGAGMSSATKARIDTAYQRRRT